MLDWQRRQEAFTRSNLTQLMLETAISGGRWTMMPLSDEATTFTITEFAARVLMLTEADRLREARTYSVGPNATGLAVAAMAGSAPQEEITLKRPPSPSGLMLFADPIGSDTETYRTADGNSVEIHTPIVAVSWSLWDGTQDHIDGHPVTWVRQNRHGDIIPCRGMTGIWMTFYAPRTADTRGVNPGQAVAVDPDGTLITAAQTALADQAFQRRDPDLYGPLAWNNELLIPQGQTFADPKPGTVQHWAATVYTTWQIMQQTGKTQLTETTRHALPPAARKKAGQKAKKTGASQKIGDSSVRVIDLAVPSRPAPKAADHDAAASDGRRTVQWSCRWPVPPYRRNTCLNPYLHHKLNDTALQHHEHREEIMPLRIKGPADKPLRVRGGTTFRFDTPAT
ncbi:hypothetical protein ACF07Y_42865 [Streptomyces sp. NPDC016566]|uniref:hypothetical protein n=1 Tax=Streptomyces sp. NPDC016566 TaxID=3364967 RepID=UPI0036FF1326